LKLHYIKNCGDAANNVVKVQENSTLSIDENCQVSPHICAETIGFKTAIGSYQVWKNGLPVLKNKVDLCELTEKAPSAIKSMIKLFGLPDHCPIEKMKRCEDGSKKADMERFKKFITLGRGGPIKIELKVDHDNGKSCIITEFEIVKK
jgi:hypothetical protein